MKRWRVPAGGALIAFLLVAAYVVVLYQPRSSRIAELTTDRDRLRAEQTPLRRNVQALEKVAEREPQLTVALQRLERLIPPRLAQPDLLAQVQGAARTAGVDLVSVTFGDPKPPEGAPASSVPGTVLVAMPVTVVVEGPFAGVTDMLGRIEAGKDRAVLVGTVALSEADARFPRLTGTWSGQAYALLPAEDPLLVDPDAPAAAPPTTPPNGQDS